MATGVLTTDQVQTRQPLATELKTHRVAARVGRAVLLLLALCFALGPIYWMFSTALKSNAELGLIDPTWYPHHPTLGQITSVLADPAFGNSLLLSSVIAVVTTVCVVTVGSAAAYAVTHWPFRGSNNFVVLILFTQLLPQAAVVVPLYLLWNSIGLVGSGIGLGLSYFLITLPVAVWMLVGFFRGIPIELSEAALVDGASRGRILFSVILPLARPALAAVGVYVVLACWGEFLLALVLLSGDSQTVTVSIGSLIGEHNPNVGPLMAASALATIPPLVVFFFLQKHFVAGLTGGAVKS